MAGGLFRGISGSPSYALLAGSFINRTFRRYDGKLKSDHSSSRTLKDLSVFAKALVGQLWRVWASRAIQPLSKGCRLNALESGHRVEAPGLSIFSRSACWRNSDGNGG